VVRTGEPGISKLLVAGARWSHEAYLCRLARLAGGNAQELRSKHFTRGPTRLTIKLYPGSEMSGLIRFGAL
jgi:hypothetical protein